MFKNQDKEKLDGFKSYINIYQDKFLNSVIR